MAKQSKKRTTVIGGSRAKEINPLGLVKQYRAVCIQENVYLSPKWRDTKAEATADAVDHINVGHFVDFEVRIKG